MFERQDNQREVKIGILHHHQCYNATLMMFCTVLDLTDCKVKKKNQIDYSFTYMYEKKNDIFNRKKLQ